ncbi:hypothetical protein [Streptomyces prasinopilosus]|uniref:Uncharacterized protein n=1 Tax=Streptomyces prasinopilosus TaxID=67344 RepID=A0A1G6WF19_9ACTN|nr:hypothetical protein [Streptomyces prasinopilosus]SDD64452.1 hypothetical protein SAMN05216505_11066 [Streptomyces prasinopilosus]
MSTAAHDNGAAGGQVPGRGAAGREITAVGHADLSPRTLALVESAFLERLERLERHVGPGPVTVRCGAGAPLAFGRAAGAAGRRLIVVVPTHDGVPAMPPPRDRTAAGELLNLADQARLLPYEPDHRDSCVGADERMIAAGGLLLAAWDGSPSDGLDATAHLVAYARARGIPVEIVWPAGAERGTGKTVPAPSAVLPARGTTGPPGARRS